MIFFRILGVDRWYVNSSFIDVICISFFFLNIRGFLKYEVFEWFYGVLFYN